jgi:hypothetical protein
LVELAFKAVGAYSLDSRTHLPELGWHPSEISIKRDVKKKVLPRPEYLFPARLLSRSVMHLTGLSDWGFLSLHGAKHWPMAKGKVEDAIVTRKRERNLF